MLAAEALMALCCNRGIAFLSLQGECISKTMVEDLRLAFPVDA